MLGRHEQAAVWLQIWTDLGRAPRTIGAYARGLAEYLPMCEREDVDPVTANRAHVAVFVRELTSRPHRRGGNVVSIESGSGLANATIQQRLVPVRLFYDFLMEEGVRESNPVSRGRYTPGGRGGGHERGLVPRTRKTIARHAADVASLEGLNGLSFGRLAADLGLSKSGVQALFGTKENLQAAAVASAHDAFRAAVTGPALAAPRGAARLRTLIERWIAYAEEPLFPGGCFWAANLPDFDSRPGPIRDALLRHQQDRRALIAAELRHAGSGITSIDADLAAFQIDAVLTAANIALRLGDKDAIAKVRRVFEGLLAPWQEMSPGTEK